MELQEKKGKNRMLTKEHYVICETVEQLKILENFGFYINISYTLYQFVSIWKFQQAYWFDSEY